MGLAAVFFGSLACFALGIVMVVVANSINATLDLLFDHHIPSPHGDTSPSNLISRAIRPVTVPAGAECLICKDVFERPVSLQCGHVYCEHCIRSALTRSDLCPLCTKTAFPTTCSNQGTLLRNFAALAIIIVMGTALAAMRRWAPWL